MKRTIRLAFFLLLFAVPPTELLWSQTEQDVAKDEYAFDPELVIEERKKALSILEKAAKGARPADAKIFHDVAEELKTATVVIPRAGQDFMTCQEDPERVAFAISAIKDVIDDTIFLCAIFAKVAHRPKFIAQTLIHEGAHLVGNVGKFPRNDECDATWVEVAAMRWSMEGLAYENSYMKECGLR